MEMKPSPPDRILRRCNSEPPLSSRFSSALDARRHCGSSSSLKERKTSLQPQHHQQKMFQDRNNNNACPLLPKLYAKSPPHHRTKKPGNIADTKSGNLPAFSVFDKNDEITSRQRGVQANKFHLRSRYMLDQTITSSKRADTIDEDISPLRQKVKEIVDSKSMKINADEMERLSDTNSMYYPQPSGCSALRRLSVITEKSTFSRNSKTAIFDLEDLERNKNGDSCQLPSVDSDSVQKPLFLKKNSQKLQEHVKRTDRQFNPVESKAVMLCNWLKTLQTEG